MCLFAEMFRDSLVVSFTKVYMEVLRILWFELSKNLELMWSHNKLSKMNVSL